MFKANINNVKRVLNSRVEQIIPIAGSNTNICNAMFDKSSQPTA